LWQNLADVNQMLVRSGKDMGLSHAKENFCRLSTMHERRQTDRHTDHWQTVTLVAIGEIACHQRRLIITIIIIVWWCCLLLTDMRTAVHRKTRALDRMLTQATLLFTFIFVTSLHTSCAQRNLTGSPVVYAVFFTKSWLA